MAQNKYRPIEILLVEDNPGDVLLTQEAFEEAKLRNNINVVTDGEMAIEYLLRKGEYADIALPDLILLDLNLPKKDGKEVLQVVKQDETLKKIPVVILTSSSAEIDIVKSYDLHANSYIVKPVDLKKFSEIVSTIEDFWFSVVILPTHL